jgi:hypothetical protein
MNKGKLQIGDLVRLGWVAGLDNGVGLVIDDHVSPRFALRYRVYWFYAGKTRRHSGRYLTKLEIPNE